MKECPRCKRVNPDSAEHCDCGYDFARASMQSFTELGICRRWMVRGVVLLNFGILCALASPPLNNPSTWRALRDTEFDRMFGVALQGWMVMSTVFVTIYFFYPLVRKSTNWESEGVRLDGWFLLIWWLAVVLLVLYGLGLGAGG